MIEAIIQLSLIGKKENTFGYELYQWLEEYVEDSEEYSKMSFGEKYELKMPDDYFEGRYLELEENLEYIKSMWPVYVGATYNQNATDTKFWYDVSCLYRYIPKLKQEPNYML